MKKKSVPRQPVQERSRENVERIARSAFQLFSKNGFDSVSIRDVARKAGVSTGTLYSYFSDKEAIFRRATDFYSEELRSALLQAIRQIEINRSGPEESFLELIRAVKGAIEKRRKIHGDVIRLALSHQEMRDDYLQREAWVIRNVQNAFLERFGPAITNEERETTVFVVHKCIEGIVEHIVLFGSDIPDDRIFRNMARMLARHLES